MEDFEEEEDDVEHLLLFLCSDLFDLIFLFPEPEEDLEEKEEDVLCLVLFFGLSFVLGKSLLLCLGDVCLLSDIQALLGGAKTMLGADI